MQLSSLHVCRHFVYLSPVSCWVLDSEIKCENVHLDPFTLCSFLQSQRPHDGVLRRVPGSHPRVPAVLEKLLIVYFHSEKFCFG